MKSLEKAGLSKDSSEKSWLQKHAHEVFLIAALGAGTQMLRDVPSSEREVPMEAKNEEKTPVVERTLRSADVPFSLEKVKDIVRVEKQLPGSRLIIQFDQWHEVNGNLIATFNSPGGLDLVINSQKDAEREIRCQIEEFETRVFFAESITEESQLNFERFGKEMKDIRNGIQAKKINPAGLMEYFEFRYGDRARMDSSKRTIDRDRGQYGYFLLCRINDVKKGVGDGMVQLSAAQLARLDQIRDELLADPVLTGDNAYLWGAYFMLFSQGEIDIHHLDNNDAIMRVFEATQELERTNPADTVAVAAARNKIIRLQNEREDRMLEVVLRYAQEHPDVPFLPLILGRAHWLRGNLIAKKIEGIGLAKVFQLKADVLANEIDKKGLFGLDLRDNADRE